MYVCLYCILCNVGSHSLTHSFTHSHSLLYTMTVQRMTVHEFDLLSLKLSPLLHFPYFRTHLPHHPLGYVCMYVCMCIWRLYMCMHVCMCMKVKFVCKHKILITFAIHTHTHIHIHTYTYTHTHTHIHIHT